MAVCLTVYDGADCIGGSKILLEETGAALILDFGTNFITKETAPNPSNSCCWFPRWQRGVKRGVKDGPS